MKDKNVQENFVRSDFPLDGPVSWTILRPGGLSNSPATGNVVMKENKVSGGMITREDVAKIVVEKCLPKGETDFKAFSLIN
jgi:hypothetical protein